MNKPLTTTSNHTNTPTTQSPIPPQPIGSHTLLELYNCSPKHLNNPKTILTALNSAAKLANATVISTQHHQFAPQGVTAIALLSESHLSIHTWPQNNYVAIDLFTCGSTATPQKATNHLIQFFNAKSHNLKTITRG